ncbi:hypothetical protein H1D32_12730 [Anaerobacillus sp. CMMVII]|uniref:hypothetical protein n=1 Tax=Anaerobacillus sp. CMMVII TaxID=2755588 RepID=UPI0021B70D40|nr:hypothetical protein [Anaerobacillus sp. CMMVII]MCT8138528.1 hypothetical protein [Anaerobacillus sp. CMMVII]
MANDFGIQTKIAVILFSLFISIFTGCETHTREDAIIEVGSTNLSNENIDGIKLGMVITENNFINYHGQFEPHPDNEYYAPKRNYDQYWNKQVIVAIDRVTKEILQIAVLEGNSTSSTEKGIRLAVPINEVITAYGEDYFTFENRGQTNDEIGYYDHVNNVVISFIHNSDEVIGISLSYAFDRLKWNE